MMHNMMSAFMQYLPELGMGWGLIIGIAVLLIVAVIYMRIRNNSRN